jgi:REP element-mobilizing transposase RayT
MNTYTQILYQIVFTPKNHEHTLVSGNCEELYKYIAGILNNKKCHLYRIGGISDHIHIVAHLHPTVALASLVKDIKVASSEFVKRGRLFPGFSGWQDGYGAFTYNISEKNKLIEYVKNQEEHHKTKSFREEIIELLNEHGIIFNEKYIL